MIKQYMNNDNWLNELVSTDENQRNLYQVCKSCGLEYENIRKICDRKQLMNNCTYSTVTILLGCFNLNKHENKVNSFLAEYEKYNTGEHWIKYIANKYDMSIYKLGKTLDIRHTNLQSTINLNIPLNRAKFETVLKLVTFSNALKVK